MNESIKYILIFLFFSCSSNNENDKSNQYEFITKNKKFFGEISKSTSGKFIELSNGFTYYELANKNKSGPVLVLIHGFSVPSYIWEPTYQKAKNLGYKVLRFDLFGRGYSENLDTDYTDELFASQSWELMDSLSINKSVLIGLSNGGRVISKMAQIDPERVEKLVYVSSNGFNDLTEKKDKTVSQNEIRNYINNYESISKGQKNDFKNPDQFKDWDIKYSELQKYKGFAKALISTLKNHVSLDSIHTELAKTNIDIYTLWGEYDTVVNYDKFEDKLNKMIPNRQEFFFKSAAHLPQMESPKEFNAVLFDYILDSTDKK